MDIKHKLYPYPMLISEADDYVKSTFAFQVRVEKGIRELKFYFEMDLKNDEMTDLIKGGQAEFLIHIECPRTCYRSIVTSSNKEFGERILEKELNGRVSLCGFVVAKVYLERYQNSDFNRDYNGMSFDIDRGSVLAIGGQYDLDITKETDDLAKVPSIFTICRYAADTDKSMQIDMDGDKITVALSDESFQNHKVLCGMPSYLPIFHGMIIVPALIYVLETLRREGIEEYESRRWFAGIRKALARYEISLNCDTLNDMASYDLAQKLLDLPIDRALQSVLTMGDRCEEEE